MANEQQQSMKDFVINGPDGAEYTVTASADATDEELIQYVQSNLPKPASTPSVQAPTAPAVREPQSPTQDVQTSITPRTADRGPTALTDEQLADYEALVRDPTKTTEDINAFLRDKQMSLGPDAQASLDEYRKAIAEGRPVSSNVEYESMARGLLGPYIQQEDPTADSWDASIEAGMANNPMGAGTRWLQDIFDTDQGGFSKDDLRERFPDYNEEEIETLHDSLIGELRRREKLNAQAQLEYKDVGGVQEFVGDAIGGASPVDIVPIVRGSKVVGQVAEGAINNFIVDGIVQAGDISYGAQGEWNYGQSAMAAGTGGALQGVFAIGAKGARRVTRTGEFAPRPEAPKVSVPTNKKGSKAYKEQIEDTVADVAVAIDDLTSTWETRPNYEVYRNFASLPKNIDRRAVGVYLGEGKVAINTEAVLKEADRMGVEPGDVVRAVTFHEGLGHFSLHAKYGDGLDDALWDIYDNADNKLKGLVDDWMARNPGAYADDPNRPIRALEELMAETAERGGELPVRLTDKLKNLIKSLARSMGMDWKVSNREVRAILATSQRDMVTGKTGADVDPADPRYMYIGRKSDDPAVSTLSLAEDMEAQGETAGDIQLDTGWSRAPDGKWRFEINDSNADFREFNYVNAMDEDQLKFVELMSEAKELPMYEVASDIEGRSLFDLIADPNIHRKYDMRSAYLGDLIDHPELFRAYPELRDVMVTRENSKAYGTFYPKTDLINISPDAPDPQATLFHEVQHWVQEKEGFAVGGNIKTGIANAPDNIVLEGSKNLARHLAKEYQDLREAFGPSDYWTAEQAKAVNTALTKSMNFRRMLEAEDVEGLRQFISQDPGARYSAYQHLFGEVEARDTQNRYREFGPGGSNAGNERQTFHRYVSEASTINPDHYIFAFDDNTGSSKSSPRYMMPGRIDPKDMTPEELFEAENAVDILRNVTEGVDRTPLSIDDLKAEAEARGFTSSDLLKRAEQRPGELTQRLIMYDIAAEKLNTKLTKLYAKLNDGTATPTTKNEYLKTLAQFQDLTARIFGEQSEAGRVLRILQDLSYTRKKVEGIQEALSGMQNALSDEADFMRFATKVQEGLAESQSKGSKLGEIWANAFNTPRALMSSLDFSAPLRQGIFMIGRKEFWQNLPGMFKYFGSKEAYDSMMREITDRPTYQIMQQAGVSFTSNNRRLASREEDFMSEWADKVPFVERSNQAYSGYLNKLRADVFDSIYTNLRDGGLDLTSDPKALKALGAYINNATGRGDLGRFNSAAPQLTTLFFSPRLIASRINILSAPFRPSFYTSLHPAVRKQYLRDLASLGAAALTVTSLASIAGADIEEDPRSSDFGKVRFGNTRYDILGGFGQYITLGARLSMFLGGSAYEKVTGEEGPGHYKTTGTGQVKKYNEGDGKFDQSASDAVARFGRNKLAPVPSYIWDGLTGSNVVGEEFDPVDSAFQRMIPMYTQDVWEMAQEYGPVQGPAMAAPGMFGVGIQNFKPTNTDPEAEIEFSGKYTDKSLEDFEDEQVRVKDGEVTIKDPAITEEWTALINQYTRERMKEEMSDPNWQNLTEKEKADIISEVRNEARREAKKEMIEVLGL